MAIKDMMLKGAKSGMLKRAKLARKRGAEVTKDWLLKEIKDDKLFLAQMARNEITLEDFEKIADKVIEDLKKKPISRF